jgi:cytochrome b6-f complex iron-sulfur subunit
MKNKGIPSSWGVPDEGWQEKIIMSIDTPPITPQQYEVLHGGGAEAAEIAKQRLSRRRFLRRSMLAVYGLATTASVAGVFYFMYPNLAGQFGTPINVGKKKEFPAALPSNFKLHQEGVFHRPNAKVYIVHLVPFRDECNSFKCPCHGSHYNVDGEWLGKPAPSTTAALMW